MRKWLVAGATVVAIGLGSGAAFATKDMRDAVGLAGKPCTTCHVGAPKEKKLTPKMTAHFEKCGKKNAEGCKSCHQGNTKGSKKCK